MADTNTTDVQKHWVIDEAGDWRALGSAIGLDMPERGALPYGPIMSAAADKGITFEIGKWRVSQTAGNAGDVWWTFKAPASGDHPGAVGEFKMSVADVKKLVQGDSDENVRLSRETIRKAIFLHFKMEDEDFVFLLENKGAASEAESKGEAPKKLGRPRGSKNKPKSSADETAESGE